MSVFSRYLCTLFGILVLLPGGVVADGEPSRDLVRFQVEVDREVENDRMLVRLDASAEDRDPARVADSINATMRWALEQSVGKQDISPASGSYQTYPVYDDKKIARWRGRQELRLESGDVDQLSRLVGVLQERLQLQSMQFSVSAQTRRRVEDALIRDAMLAFKQRAQLIVTSLDAKGYELVEMGVNTAGMPPVVPLRMEQASLMSKSRASQPAVERGTSKVTVQLSISVRLLRQ